MAPRVTMQELVSAVAEHAQSEAEVLATVVHMVNTGLVRLAGFDLRTLPTLRAAAA